MTVTIALPEELALEIDRLVNAGEYGSRDEAAAALIRRGLAGGGRPYRPPPLPGPTPYRDPSDDRPIDVKPWDVNWVDKG